MGLAISEFVPYFAYCFYLGLLDIKMGLSHKMCGALFFKLVMFITY